MKIKESDGRPFDWIFECPGCGCLHGIKTNTGGWSFDGNMENPTISPSILVRGYPVAVCHSFVKNGQIQFLSDCTHELKGQTIELPQI